MSAVQDAIAKKIEKLGQEETQAKIASGGFKEMELQVIKDRFQDKWSLDMTTPEPEKEIEEEEELDEVSNEEVEKFDEEAEELQVETPLESDPTEEIGEDGIPLAVPPKPVKKEVGKTSPKEKTAAPKKGKKEKEPIEKKEKVAPPKKEKAVKEAPPKKAAAPKKEKEPKEPKPEKEKKVTVLDKTGKPELKNGEKSDFVKEQIRAGVRSHAVIDVMVREKWGVQLYYSEYDRCRKQVDERPIDKAKKAEKKAEEKEAKKTA